MTSMLALWTGALLTLASGPVTEVSITPVAGQTSVLVAVEGEVEYRDFTLQGPNRLVLDLMGARHALPREKFTSVHRGGVRAVSTSQYSADMVRVVLELDRLVGYTIVPDERGLRILLENPAGGFEPWSSGTTQLAAAAPDAPAIPRAQAQQQQSTAPRIRQRWVGVPIQDVLLAFAEFSGKSIVPGSNVGGVVTADINNQPWDVAFATILATQGLAASEDEYGIIRVDNLQDLNQREQVEQLITRTHRISYATATELAQAIQPLLTPQRGSIVVGQATNTIVVTDIQRVQTAVADLLSQLDIRTPQVSIQAKIIFVNRTDLAEFGINYELKDSRGNQLNQLSDGAFDQDGDGQIELPEESVDQGEAVVVLGGNSVAALGNAGAGVTNPTLRLLASLVVGRHQLISFIDALESVNLSDIQATPQVMTLDNQQAEIVVGELTPIRTIDAGATGGGAGFPTAQVEQQQTGIILRATPHVTASGTILLQLEAERSSAELAESDAGFIFRNQRAVTRVLVEDGETVVIAGLTQSERVEAFQGIPLLMDLPVLGRLFRVRRHQEVQRDLIILVTPHIVRGTN